MRRYWLFCLLASCGDNGAGSSEAPDAFSVCFGTAPDSRVCFAHAPTFAPMSLPATIDTATACASDVLEPDACVLVADSILIDTRVTVSGPRPLLLLARDSIMITSSGVLDVSTTKDRTGAGANSDDCSTASGAGGTFGGSGGTSELPAAPLQPVSTLRGGCPGGIGVNLSAPGGVGGGGGGALSLIAPAITIDGIINVSGAPGRGCGPLNFHGGCGGGGGGSGGMLVLDAMTLAGAGTLMANGAGGGSGEASPGIVAPDGIEPNEATPLTPALGGDRDDDGLGGRGGAGAAGPTFSGQAGTFAVDGPLGFTRYYGGGGGGAGIIRIHGDNTGFAGPISPPPNQPAP